MKILLYTNLWIVEAVTVTTFFFLVRHEFMCDNHIRNVAVFFNLLNDLYLILYI